MLWIVVTSIASFAAQLKCCSRLFLNDHTVSCFAKKLRKVVSLYTELYAILA